LFNGDRLGRPTSDYQNLLGSASARDNGVGGTANLKGHEKLKYDYHLQHNIITGRIKKVKVKEADLYSAFIEVPYNQGAQGYPSYHRCKNIDLRFKNTKTCCCFLTKT